MYIRGNRRQYIRRRSHRYLGNFFIQFTCALWTCLAQSQICHCAPPTLSLSGSSNTQAMIGNSGHMLTWCPIAKCSVFTKAQQQAMSCFSESTCLQMMPEPCSKSLKAFAAIYLWGPARDTKQRLHLPLTLRVPLGLLDHMAPAGEHPAHPPGPVAEPFPV